MNLEKEVLNSGSAVKVAEKIEIKVKGGKAYAFFKRAFDIFSSAIALIVLFPFLLIIGILVKVTSKGPVFYVSDRVGKNGKVFKFYKFRTMVKDAEQQLDQLLEQNEVEGGVTFKMENDPRLTKFGKFLRKSSIDELPQLLNILKGDMSVVGPRPCTPRELELYGDKEKNRLLVPQGLTGEWQVNGRSNTTFDEMIDLDLRYIEKKRGFWYDIGIIFRTLPAVFRQNGK